MVFYEVPDTILRLIPQSAPPELPPREMVQSKNISNYTKYEQLDYVHVPNLPVSEKKQKLQLWKPLFCGVLSFLVISALVSFGAYVYSKETSLSECSSGYVYFNQTGFCYKVTLFDVSFEAANDLCNSENAQLASIHSAEENDFIHGLYVTKHADYQKNVDSNMKKHSLWIGLVYLNNNWEWTDGTKVDYLSWALDAQKEMNNERKWTALITSKHNRLAVTGNEWYPLLSSERRAFVCKKKSEKQQLNHFFKPTESHPACLSGYTYFSETQFCYKAYPKMVTFDIAKVSCAKDKSTLISIHSEQENNFVIKITRESFDKNENTYYYRHRIWTGLVFSNQTRQWNWEDGSVVNYTNWMRNEPDRLHHEHWVSIVIEFTKGTNPYGTKWINQDNWFEESFVCKQAPL